MKKMVIAVVFVVTLCAEAPQSQPKAFGSGVFISTDGLFLTAAHVVEGSTSLQVVTPQRTVSAKILQVDRANDVALLKCEGTFVPVQIRASGSVKLGQTVFTLGYPDIQIQGISPKMTKGEISSLTGFQDDPRQWQVSVPVQPGNSGGPLFDEQGNLIGLIEGGLDAVAVARATGDVPQNVNYAVKSAYLMPMLDPYTAELPKEAAPPATSQKMEDVVSHSIPSIGLVMVYGDNPTQPDSDRNAGLSLYKFIDDYLSRSQSGSNQNEIDLYADQVDYFGDGVKDRSYITSDIEKYNAKWPQHLMGINGTPDLRHLYGDTYYIAFNLTYFVSNGSLSKRGTVLNEMNVTKLNGEWKITMIRETKK
jgi:hypothetical protein